MRLLLDTHVVLWQLAGVQRLGVRASEAIASAAELAFSVVSFAEIGAKAAIGKLTVPGDLHAHVLGTGLRVLGLAPDHGLAVARRNALLLKSSVSQRVARRTIPGPSRSIESGYVTSRRKPARTGSRTTSPTRPKVIPDQQYTQRPDLALQVPLRTHGTSTGTSGRPRAATDTYRCRCA